MELINTLSDIYYTCRKKATAAATTYLSLSTLGDFPPVGFALRLFHHINTL